MWENAPTKDDTPGVRGFSWECACEQVGFPLTITPESRDCRGKTSYRRVSPGTPLQATLARWPELYCAEGLSACLCTGPAIRHQPWDLSPSAPRMSNVKAAADAWSDSESLSLRTNWRRANWVSHLGDETIEGGQE